MMRTGGGRRTTAGTFALGLLLLPSGADAQHQPFRAAEDTVPGLEEPPPPKLVINGFGDIDFKGGGSTGRKNSTFALGQLDLFVTSELTDDVSVLAEIVFEPGEGTEKVVDVERYQIKYSHSDLLNVALGRMHTALGYWNQTHHHGRWFQTTAFRPEIYRFEDEDGVLPVHQIGLQLFGAKPLPGLRLEYNFSVANGRGLTPTDIVQFVDRNPAKAWNFWMAGEPNAIPGLRLGGVAHLDTIPSDPQNPERLDPLRERIFGGFLAYEHARRELYGEYIVMDHEDAARGKTYRTRGGYLQAAYRLGHFKPYYRFDTMRRDTSDPFLANPDPSLRIHLLGLRVDPRAWTAVKLEFSHNREDTGSHFLAGVLQVAFSF